MVALAAILIFGLAGGWLLATVFVSPEQRDAAARPPSPEAITAVVVKGDLADTVSANSTVARSNVQSIPISAAEGPAVVTRRTVSSGDEVDDGDVLIEINGRPVFVLPGKFPYYRDLRPGDSGPDVKQLQAGLVAAGYSVKVDGAFGPGTATALRTLYRDAGYTAPMEEAEGGPQEPGGASSLLLPRLEIAAVLSTPATVRSTPSVGAELPEGSAIELESGALVATAMVPDGFRSRLVLDMPGVLRFASGDVAVEVASIGEPDPETGESRVVLKPLDPLDEGLLGRSVTVFVTISLAAKDSLIVPTRAVVPNGNGDPSVSRQNDDGTFELVAVRELAQLAGRSAVEPIEEGDLEVGDLVRVG